MTSTVKLVHNGLTYRVLNNPNYGYYVSRISSDYDNWDDGDGKYLRNGSWETYGPTYYNHFEYALTALRDHIASADRLAVEVEARERQAKDQRRKELTHQLERLVKNKNGLDKSINKVLGEIEALKS